MNLILLFEDDFIGETRVRLHGRRFDHLIKIHRAAAGDRFCVGKAGGLIGTGEILSLGRNDAEMEVRLGQPPPPAPAVTLILALPRPKFMRRILFSASTMGAKKIVLLNSYRVEKSYWQSPFLNKDQIDRQLCLSLEQARDTIMPEVLLRPLFKPFVEDELPEIIRGTQPLLGDPDAGEHCPHGVDGPVTLVVGPEGGFIPFESDKFLAAGFRAVSLGDRILNVESAVPAFLGRLF